jgi:hypothetical protein
MSRGREKRASKPKRSAESFGGHPQLQKKFQRDLKKPLDKPHRMWYN